MPRYFTILVILMALLTGCGPTAQERYNDAANELDRAQAELNKLRPAYDAAPEMVADALCKEISHMTPAEFVKANLQKLPLSDMNLSEIYKKADELEAKPMPSETEVMKSIKTPGTPEADWFEKKLAAMPAVQAYKLQQSRVEHAQKDVDRAKAVLPK